jgi:hypothetical protein
MFGGPDDPNVRSPKVAATARILITVKTSPNPSATHGETVCVAGLRLGEERPGWTRLFPINFRELDEDKKFQKYAIISVRVRPPVNDSRFESFTPDSESIRKETWLPPWHKRVEEISHWIGGDTCSLVENALAKPDSQSLALIRPASIDSFHVERNRPWTPKEQSKIDQYLAQGELWGTKPPRLKAPRFNGYYVYRCQRPDCPTHRQKVLDWEFTTFQYKLLGLSDTEAEKRIREKWHDELCATTKDTCFYLGNLHALRGTFSILGLWYPPKA